MCSVQEEAIPEQTTKLTGELKCVKCRRDVPVVVKRVNDAFCQDCFLVYAVHKFRSALGKSKVILPKEHVLVAYSGGAASSALLHFIQQGIKEEKLRFTASVVHIDELGLVSLTDKERKGKVEDVIKMVSQRGFPLFLTCIEQAMDVNSAEGNPKNSPVVCEEVTPETDIGDVLGSDGGGNLKKLLDALPSISAREECIRVLRNQLLLAVARQRGFTKVVLGDTATLLSVRIMTDMAKGKGSQVSFDTSIGDERYGDIMMVRPLRELNFKEVEAYNRLQNVESVSLPSITDQWHSGNSIEQLTSTFIQGLQDNFPSTVPNIVRTSNKLGHQGSKAGQGRCAMCESPLDTDVGEASALRAVEISERLLQRGGTLLSPTSSHPADGDALASSRLQPDGLPSDGLKTSLCYGCRLMVKGLEDSSLLPQHIIRKSEVGVLTQEEMHSQISEFLLEEDVDNM